MIPTYHNLNQIKLADLEGLVAIAAAEDERLDFKVDDYARPDEFCKDISAMANTDGGCLVLGVEETDGVATAILGIGQSLCARMCLTTVLVAKPAKPHGVGWESLRSDDSGTLADDDRSGQIS